MQAFLCQPPVLHLLPVKYKFQASRKSLVGLAMHLDTKGSIRSCVADIACTDDINTQTEDGTVYRSNNRERTASWCANSVLERLDMLRVLDGQSSGVVVGLGR